MPTGPWSLRLGRACAVALAVTLLAAPLAARDRSAHAAPPPRSTSGTSAGHRIELPLIARTADRRPWRSFMSSPGLAVEAMGMLRGGWGKYDGLAYLRAMANLRLGPLALGVGAIVGSETRFNVHLDVFSYQSAGWQLALGAGLADGGTLRFAFPIVDGLRGRVMTSFGPLGFSGGLGLEVEPW